jgi:hypothetical protein
MMEMLIMASCVQAHDVFSSSTWHSLCRCKSAGTSCLAHSLLHVMNQSTILVN